MLRLPDKNAETPFRKLRRREEPNEQKDGERAAKAGDARQHRCRSVFTAPVGNKWHKKCNTLLKNRDERSVEKAARKQKKRGARPSFLLKKSVFFVDYSVAMLAQNKVFCLKFAHLRRRHFQWRR